MNRTEEARAKYLAHLGETPADQTKPWEELIVDDFQVLRESGREHPLMDKITREFKLAHPLEADR